MKSLILVLVGSLMMTGCGAVDRMTSSFTGGGTTTCVDGVAYLQFTSGATVKYTRDGKIALCK